MDAVRESWKGRLLRATFTHTPIAGRVKAREHMGAVALSVIGHTYESELVALMAFCFPGFYSIDAPFLCSAGKVWKTGHVVADVVVKNDEQPKKRVVIFKSLRDMETRWRRVADRLRLDDADRVELFDAVKRWVVADYRLDPHMDPADPDARRLVH